MVDRYRVILSPEISSDLTEIHCYIEKDSPQNAAAIVERLLDAIDSLAHLPHRYPLYEGLRQPSEFVRRMPVPPYLVYYRLREAEHVVEVITVRHGKRQQPRSF